MVMMPDTVEVAGRYIMVTYREELSNSEMGEFDAYVRRLDGDSWDSDAAVRAVQLVTVDDFTEEYIGRFSVADVTRIIQTALTYT